jgi:hypothetical protein
MVAVRLEDEALAFAASQLDAAGGGIAGELHQEALWEPVVFVPDFIDPLALPDLEAGHVASPEGSAAELAGYLLFLQKRNPALKSVIFDDPWASPGDLDYAGPPPDELLTLQGHVSYLYDLAAVSPDLVLDYRSIAVSYLKIVYVSELTPAEIRALAEEEPDDVFHRLAHSVRYVAINAYDDESWLILRHEQSEHGKKHCQCGHDDCDCDGDCDGDCDCDGDGPECHHHANDD